MQQRRAGLHRRFRIEHRRQHLVLNPQRSASRLGRRLAVGKHGGDTLADKAHHIVQHPRIVRIVQRILVPRGGEASTWRVGRGQDAVHTRNRQGRRGVDRHDPGMRVRRTQQLQVQQARWQGHVQRVAGCAGDDRRPGRGCDTAAKGDLAVRRLGVPDAADRVGDRAIPGAAAQIPLHRGGQVLKLRLVQGLDAVSTIPGVQKPHWKPCAATNRACMGCIPSGPATSPSIVVTSRCLARNAGVTQLCTGWPSSSTVQAPQSPASQPFLTPNQPKSRRKVRRHWPGRGEAGLDHAVDGHGHDDCNSRRISSPSRNVMCRRQSGAP